MGCWLQGTRWQSRQQSAPGGAPGVAIVSTALTNAGTIIVRGGAGSQGGGAPGTPGGLLDVLGVLTDQGADRAGWRLSRHGLQSQRTRRQA